MEYFVNMPNGRFHEPGVWAAEMEQQKWDGICASDHLWVSSHYPHVFVAATQMACATSKIKLTTSFCNNLFRSPVEFAQAALALQLATAGRFEAGLGAGWEQSEMLAMGLPYPKPGERISMYIEAMQVAGSLLKTGQCDFSGEHYQVNITGDAAIGPVSEVPPLLIGSAGGPRGIREITPLVDRMEIQASARSTRAGHLDLAIMATVTEDELKQNIERVRKVSTDIPIGVFIIIAAGENQAITGIKAMLGDGFLGNFIGHPEGVAESLAALEGLGIDRVQLTEFAPGSHAALAPSLVSTN